MRYKLSLVCLALVFVGVCAWSWYWFSHGGRAAGMARSQDPQKRLEAIRDLRGKSNSLALRTLRALCDDADHRVATQAVRAIGAADQEENRQVLVELLADGARGLVRGEAAAALGHCKGADPKPLIDLLRKGNPQERLGALKGLARKRERSALPAIVDALDDDDPRVRAVAIVAIQKVIAIRFQFQPHAGPEVRGPQVESIRSFLRTRGNVRRRR